MVLVVLLLLLCLRLAVPCVLCITSKVRQPVLRQQTVLPPPLLPRKSSRLCAALSPLPEPEDVDAFLRSKGFTPTPPEPDDDDDEPEKNPELRAFMLGAIEWYRSTLSPLMPRNCRFLPTCSQYGLDAIKRYGSIRGGLLTAWRILRCNPIGGSGYDAPQWPPPGFFAGSNTFANKK